MSNARGVKVSERLARRGSLIGAVVLVLASVAALPAAADPIGGATYTGIAASGARVTFTVSPDGTLVDSYRISAVHGGTCQIYAEGDKGVWQGAPITGGAFTFNYQFYDAITFRGAFPGAQSASGIFRLYTHATSATPACDTGVVSWTARTTATPPPAGAGGSGPPGSGPGGKGAKPRFATRIALRKLSKKKLGGRVTSSAAACRAGRTVILWRGSRRIASTRTKANGSYSFNRASSVRGRRVRASVLAKQTRSAVCMAGSSIFVSA